VAVERRRRWRLGFVCGGSFVDNGDDGGACLCWFGWESPRVWISRRRVRRKTFVCRGDSWPELIFGL
jgi:hypothetical protein